MRGVVPFTRIWSSQSFHRYLHTFDVVFGRVSSSSRTWWTTSTFPDISTQSRKNQQSIRFPGSTVCQNFASFRVCEIPTEVCSCQRKNIFSEEFLFLVDCMSLFQIYLTEVPYLVTITSLEQE